MKLKYKRFQGNFREVEDAVNRWLDEQPDSLEVVRVDETFEPQDVYRPVIHTSIFYTL